MTQGILTATDRTMFDGLIWWHRAVRETGYAALCIDLGITQRQREIAALEQIPLASPPRHLPVFDFHPLMWVKPFLIAASPFDQTLWVDVDAMVIRSPQAIFEAIERGPVVMTDPLANHFCPNRPELYRLFPVPGGDLEMGLNSGVVGVDKIYHERLLREWVWITDQAHKNPQLRCLLIMEDQGALIWAMLKCGHQPTGRNAWNYPGDGLICRLDRRDCRENNADFLNHLRNDHLMATVVHYLGVPKYWQHWPRTA